MSRMEELNQYYEVWRETNYIYEDWAKQHGTSACCLLTLISIDESEDPCTQKRISQQWSMPKQTTNMVLKDLESKGYVELVPLPEDKRNKQIRFTEAGQAICRQHFVRAEERRICCHRENGTGANPQAQ